MSGSPYELNADPHRAPVTVLRGHSPPNKQLNPRTSLPRLVIPPPARSSDESLAPPPPTLEHVQQDWLNERLMWDHFFVQPALHGDLVLEPTPEYDVDKCPDPASDAEAYKNEQLRQFQLPALQYRSVDDPAMDDDNTDVMQVFRAAENESRLVNALKVFKTVDAIDNIEALHGSDAKRISDEMQRRFLEILAELNDIFKLAAMRYLWQDTSTEKGHRLTTKYGLKHFQPAYNLFWHITEQFRERREAFSRRTEPDGSPLTMSEYLKHLGFTRRRSSEREELRRNINEDRQWKRKDKLDWELPCDTVTIADYVYQDTSESFKQYLSRGHAQSPSPSPSTRTGRRKRDSLSTLASALRLSPHSPISSMSPRHRSRAVDPV
ncbi:hypothetical protein JCM11641_003022 [Rhodosporidiobolus odoratus]